MWIVVADGSTARILEGPGPIGTLNEVTDLSHEESRLKNRDFDTDRPGRSMDDVGLGKTRKAKSAYEPEETPKQKEKQRFAREIAQILEEGRLNGEFEKIALISPPKFLGMLRKALGKPTTDCVVQEVTKDLTGADTEAIQDNLTRFHS